MERARHSTYEDLRRQMAKGAFSPVYLLMGEEDYYIDLATQALIDSTLTPEERDFNLTVLYGAETKAGEIINVARQFPVMATRRVVVVKEFQALQKKQDLSIYAKAPAQTTVLILCHKHGPLDTCKALLTEVRKTGTVMESRRPYESQLPSFIMNYMKESGHTIERQAVQMLCEHVGNDLTRLASEMDKLMLVLPKGAQTVEARLVEELTGVNKEYNNFELQEALARRDVLKANKIVNYFHDNPRSFVPTLTLTSLFTFFTDVLTAYYAPEQSENGIAAWIGKSPWAARQGVIPAQGNYRASKVVDILSRIRETDAKCKGVGGCKTPAGELLRELVYFILH